jgi:hypothetical protein
MMKRIVFAAFTLSLMFVIPTAAQSDSTVVQASKQKSTDKKAKKIFTNEDYPEKPELSPASIPSTAGATGRDTKPGADKTVPHVGAEGKPVEVKLDEKQGEVKETKQALLEKKLDTAKREEQELRQKLAKLQEKADNEADENRRGMYLDIISNQQTTLSEYRRSQEDLQKQIEDEKNKDKKAE